MHAVISNRKSSGVSFISLLIMLFILFFKTIWLTAAMESGQWIVTSAEDFMQGELTLTEVQSPGQLMLVKESLGLLQIQSGSGHTLALRADGTVWAWGANNNGQLGDGTTTNQLSPVQVKGINGDGYLSEIIAVAAGESHSVALSADGSVFAWGGGLVWPNDYYGIGDGSSQKRPIPVQVKGIAGVGYLSEIVDIAAGSGHTIALRSDGTVVSWGYNGSGQLGDGTTISKTTPVLVKDINGSGNLMNIIKISAGTHHTLAISSQENVFAWGNNGGKLGDGTTKDSSLPVLVKGPNGESILSGVIEIAGGWSHSAGVKHDGSVYAWGRNYRGQLGNGSLTDSYVPVQVKGSDGVGNLSSVIKVSNGLAHTLVLKADGSVWSWGSNDSGQLGIYNQANSSIPKRVLGPNNIGYLEASNINAFSNHSSALTTGTGSMWGSNTSGQLGDGTTQMKITPFMLTSESLKIYRYSNTGVYISSIFDTQNGSVFKDISWDMSVPVEAGSDAVKFQVATKKVFEDGQEWNFVGPDGTADTFYTNSGQVIWQGHTGDQYIKYKLYMSTNNTDVTPIVHEVRIDYEVLDTTPPTGSIVVNDDAECTNNRGVTLTINAEDPGNPDSIFEMRFSNDNLTWSDWEPYKTSKSWTLSSGDGEKTIYAQFKDGSGNVSTEYVFKDTFDNITFKDPMNTTAEWDTSNGKIKLSSLYSWGEKALTPGFTNRVKIISDGSKVYALPGASNTFYSYDPLTNSWTSRAPTPAIVDFMGALTYDSINNKIYAFRGNNKPDFWEYDPLANLWSVKSPSPASISYWGGALTYNTNDGMIYAISSSGTDFWAYDPKLNSWLTKASIPSNLDGGSLSYSPKDNKIYLLRNSKTKDFFAYDPLTDTWSVKASVPGGSEHYAGFIFNEETKKLYVTRGYNEGGYQTADFYSYDIAKDLWSVETPLPTTVSCGALTYVNAYKKIYSPQGIWPGTYKFWSLEETYISPKIAQSLTVDQTSADILRATLNATERLNGQSVNYQLSRDGGVTWEDVVKNQEHEFTSISEEKSDLRWRAMLNGTEDVSPVILDISVTYNREPISDSIKLDQTPPDILLTSPEPRSYLQTDETIPVNYWVSDDLSSAITEEASLIYKDPSGQQQVIPVQKGQNLREVTELVPGNIYTLQVNATDDCGNIATKSINFTIAPSISASYYSCNGLYADKLVYRKTPAPYAEGDPLNTLGAPDDRSYRLGDDGNYIELEFVDNKVVDKEGYDLAVYASQGYYKVYAKNEDQGYVELGRYYANELIDLDGRIDNVTVIKIVSDSYRGPYVDAAQAIHPGPYADRAIGNVTNQNLLNATGPKDGIGVAIGAGKFIELYFDDNQPVDGPGYDLRIHEAQVKESYKLSIKESDNAGFIDVGQYKGSQNIDLSDFGLTKAVAVRMEGISDQYAADIDSLEALHPGSYADEIMYSNIKTADQKEPVGLENILGPRDGVLTGLIKRGQFVELAFTDNEIINGDGPDIAIFAPSEVISAMPAGAYKLFVKESASDVGFKEVITPKRLIGNQNVYLNDDIKKVEILRIVGDSTNLTKFDAVEALHTCDENDIIIRLQSDFNVWPGGSEPVANIAASITPLHIEPGYKLATLKASIDGIPINLGNNEINLQNGTTSTISFSVSLPNVSADHTGKHEVILNIPGEQAEGRITLFNNGLQKALDNSSGHNRLMLANGIYNEPIIARKPVVIQGNNRKAYMKYTKYPENTVLDAAKADKGIHVKSDHVEIYDLTIKNNNHGIYAPDVLGLEIYHNNILAYDASGIYVEGLLDRPIHGDYPTIRYNYIDSGKSLNKADHIKTVKKKVQPIENIPATVGIGTRNSDLNIITYNTIINNVVGIKLWNSKLANAISANSLKNNLIAFYYDPIDFETEIDFSDNEIIDSKLGVVFAHPDTTLLNINDNIIEKAQVGVLGIAGYANIYNNNIGDSEVGIFAPSSNMKVYDNIFSSNEINNPEGISDALQKEISSILLWALLGEPNDIKNTIFSVTNKGIANSLRSKLDGVYIDMVDTMVHIDNAKPKLANNSLSVAINRLGALQNEIQALEKNHISAAEKDNLLVLVKILQRQLEYMRQ